MAHHGTSRKIEDDYDKIGVTIGSGATSVVKVCKAKNGSHAGKHFAVKIIERKNSFFDEDKFKEEIAILARVQHPNVISLCDVYETPDRLFIVTELARGGELFDRILQNKHFSEREASILALQLCSGIAYLHANGICHR